MSNENALTAAQSELHDRVLAIAGWDGADCKDVLDSLDAPPGDKAAVAEVLGGPGAGAEYTADTADAQSNPADETSRADPAAGSQFERGDQVRDNADDQADGNDDTDGM